MDITSGMKGNDKGRNMESISKGIVWRRARKVKCRQEWRLELMEIIEGNNEHKRQQRK